MMVKNVEVKYEEDEPWNVYFLRNRIGYKSSGVFYHGQFIPRNFSLSVIIEDNVDRTSE